MAEVSKFDMSIKRLIQAKCLYQDRFSKLADTSYDSVIKPETGGIINPTIETLQKVAKVLSAFVDILLK